MFLLVTIFLLFAAILLTLGLFEFEFDKQAQTYLRNSSTNLREKSFFAKFYENIRYIFFMLRWFLIGKYRCNIPKEYKAFYWAVNRFLWLSVIFCMWYFFVMLFEGKT